MPHPSLSKRAVRWYQERTIGERYAINVAATASAICAVAYVLEALGWLS